MKNIKFYILAAAARQPDARKVLTDIHTTKRALCSRHTGRIR